MQRIKRAIRLWGEARDREVTRDSIALHAEVAGGLADAARLAMALAVSSADFILPILGRMISRLPDDQHPGGHQLSPLQLVNVLYWEIRTPRLPLGQ